MIREFHGPLPCLLLADVQVTGLGVVAGVEALAGLHAEVARVDHFLELCGRLVALIAAGGVVGIFDVVDGLKANEVHQLERADVAVPLGHPAAVELGDVGDIAVGPQVQALALDGAPTRG